MAVLILVDIRADLACDLIALPRHLPARGLKNPALQPGVVITRQRRCHAPVVFKRSVVSVPDGAVVLWKNGPQFQPLRQGKVRRSLQFCVQHFKEIPHRRIASGLQQFRARFLALLHIGMVHVRAARLLRCHGVVPLLNPTLQHTTNAAPAPTPGHKTDLRVQRQPVGLGKPPAPAIAHQLAIQLGHDCVVIRITVGEGGVVACQVFGRAACEHPVCIKAGIGHLGHGREVRWATKRPQHQPRRGR
ncbi:hypothetical protein D3C71_1314540 [compost metagenome]